ncbi:hypothetical protein FHR24_003009 [Wenyingzhuangia heitensis]|uniref:Starch-binding associating with outer membrane n=1 Tax=Wenyingzhuangia heitensis TaxID=1487859 RepID=A0ABX0UG63_9FLAO|nr:RagB/SusD family nutrient uptake outer membrane protein [Wenyingzhuangia heitensis]NIJ46521.1 hypothetical protein [Wenyingzhuangia heitensis]
MNLNKKNITKCLAFISLSLSVVFQSCDIDLEENAATNNAVIKPYEIQEDLEYGVTGIYGQLRQAAWMTTFYVNAWSGDDITTHKASNKADFREYDQRAVSNGNSRTATNWRGVYSMIRAANTVLASSESLTLEDKTLQDQLLGETYFLRGTLFFHLTRIHGRIPLTLDVSTPDPELTLATQQQVYEQIESDLLTAEGMLPGKTDLGAVKPNSGSARALLARLYLDWAGFQGGDVTKYADAASSAKQVIDNKATHGFELVDDFDDIFKSNNRFNSEGVWSIAYCSSCGLANRKYGKLGLPGDFAGWQETFAEIRFFEDFPDSPRKDATYHSEIPVNVEIVDGSEKITVTSDPSSADKMIPWTEFKDQQNPLFKKIVGPWEDNIFGVFETDRNDFYMRYAEVLLIYAEASGRSGNVTADSWEALNMIRRRAEGLPYATPNAGVDLTSGDIAELAFTERKWEFAGEFLRWYDLVRMERVSDALSNRAPQSSIGTIYDTDGNPTATPITTASNPVLGSLGTDNYFVGIPAGEIAKHPALGATD